MATDNQRCVFTPNMGFMEIAGKITLSHMADQADAIIRRFDDIWDITYRNVPLRDGHFMLGRRVLTPVTRREDCLERAIVTQWPPCREAKDFVLDACIYTLVNQMPLAGGRCKETSGRMDIVGVSSEAHPVAIEVKDEDSNDTPLKVLLQAAAYGVTILKAWNDGNKLASEWQEAINALIKNELLRGDGNVPRALERVPLICMAPASYWKQRIEGPHKKVRPARAWCSFHKVVEMLVAKGLPAHFWQFEASPPIEGTLPIITNLRKVDLP